MIDLSEEVDRLGAVVFELGKAIDIAKDNLNDHSETWNADLSPFLFRDYHGRYILADLLGPYASAMAAYLTLKVAVGGIHESNYADPEAPPLPPRPNPLF